MERLIELFINTEDGEFYDRGGLLAAYDPAINAGELVRLTVQLCAGVPAFNSAGALLNPDTTFAGTLAAAETIIDNNFNWYDKGTLLENLTTGTAISELSVASEAAPRQLGAVRLNAGTVVNFCGWTATEGGYRLTLADNEFNPAQFTPPADFAQGAAVEVLEQPIIVSAQNDDSGRDTGLFSGLLDAANPVYESMIEGQEDIPNCRIEFSIYQDGRAVFRARRYFDCLGAMAMNKGAAYVHSDSWREADSRYIKLVDWQAPPEYQFSEDGTNWHDQQQDADLYYHERRPGGQWGQAVKMKTGPTGAAAGFGTPTIAVETLPAGSDATASVTASGDNTAKVFSFSLGIPKGADGQNGTDGKAGADGADGVSSYTYVAYASDASGAGFSLTPSNALKFRAEIHTTTAIETPDAEDFAGATWVKYIGDDGTGAGDMTKAVYDTNDDGIVDHAATADAVGATTAAQVADAVGKAHTHANKTTLDKLAEADGKLTYDGAEIGGGSGTVKSVNGQLPDESGNVTIETGGVVDESRLLPTGGKDGDILGYQEGVDRGNGADVRLLLQNALTDSANGNAAPAAVTTQGVTLTGDNNLLFDGNDSHVTAVLATDEIFAADKEWTIDFWMKPTANSSEWNYILTENRGDWGSHSIGLTWNKTKNVLEQDTGGYLASVIRSSNWPNDSVACAASEWHFVAVEKQKTASGWNLNYYLNGAIWLQVAFTADFVPFDASDNPFWFGGKTTDSGRWFKGEVNKLRVTMGARYGGKAFAVPDRLTDYAAPAGQPVWTKGIDRSRLLPDVSSLTQADDGKVMQFKFTSAEAEVPFCCNCQALMPDTTNQLVNDSGTGTTLTLGNTLAVSDVPGPFGGNCVSGIGNDGDSYTISISPRVAFSAADDFTLEWWLRPPTNALDRKSTRLNSSHVSESRMPSSA